jgi:hypothetical protein
VEVEHGHARIFEHAAAALEARREDLRRVVEEQENRRPAFRRRLDGADDGRRLAAFGDAHQHVAGADAHVGDLAASEDFVVLEGFHGLDHCVVAARHDAVHAILERREALVDPGLCLGQIHQGAPPHRLKEDAQAAGGATSGEHHPAAACQRAENRLRQGVEGWGREHAPRHRHDVAVHGQQLPHPRRRRGREGAVHVARLRVRLLRGQESQMELPFVLDEILRPRLDPVHVILQSVCLSERSYPNWMQVRNDGRLNRRG